jgi:hypothetical protein
MHMRATGSKVPAALEVPAREIYSSLPGLPAGVTGSPQDMPAHKSLSDNCAMIWPKPLTTLLRRCSWQVLRLAAPEAAHQQEPVRGKSVFPLGRVFAARPQADRRADAQVLRLGVPVTALSMSPSMDMLQAHSWSGKRPAGPKADCVLL